MELSGLIPRRRDFRLERCLGPRQRLRLDLELL